MDWYDPFNPYWQQQADLFAERAAQEDFSLTAFEREIMYQGGLSLQDLMTPSGQIAFNQWVDILNASNQEDPNMVPEYVPYVPPAEAGADDPNKETDMGTPAPTAPAENVFAPPPWDTRLSTEENVAKIQEAATKWQAGKIAGGIATKYEKEHKQNNPEVYAQQETPAKDPKAYANPGEYYANWFTDTLGTRGFNGDQYASLNPAMNELYASYGLTDDAAGAKKFTEDLYHKLGLKISQTTRPSGQIGGYAQPLTNNAMNQMDPKHLYYLTQKKAMEATNPYDPVLRNQGALKEKLYKEYETKYGL